MKKVLTRYSCVFFFLIGSFVMFADGPVVPPPNGLTCCDEEFNATGNQVAYDLCKGELEKNPDYCKDTVPIDNSIYIYISMVAAVALASFVIARRMKT